DVKSAKPNIASWATGHTATKYLVVLLQLQVTSVVVVGDR
ncbi:hypothetical protein Tco_0979662, partial [Tanacetum coccineum]